MLILLPRSVPLCFCYRELARSRIVFGHIKRLTQSFFQSCAAALQSMRRHPKAEDGGHRAVDLWCSCHDLYDYTNRTLLYHIAPPGYRVDAERVLLRKQIKLLTSGAPSGPPVFGNCPAPGR